MEQAGELLASVVAGYAAARPEEESAAVAVETAAGLEYMHSATRHCYYQRAMLQLLLRQLRFCAAELQGAPRPLSYCEVLGLRKTLCRSIGQTCDKGSVCQ